MLAKECLDRLVLYTDIQDILDIGSGQGQQAEFMKLRGKKVTTVNLKPPADIIGDYLSINVEKFDAIWASHVLEHVLNPDLFLKKCFNDLRDNGILAVTVPPLKHQVVGGHINLFNAGILLYRLILSGFDCRNARVGTYGYNISVIVRKQPVDLPTLNMDNGDIEKIKKYFPMEAHQGFDGRIPNINW